MEVDSHHWKVADMQIVRLQFRRQGRNHIQEGRDSFHNSELKAQGDRFRNTLIFELPIALSLIVSMRRKLRAQDQRVHKRQCSTVGVAQIHLKLFGHQAANFREYCRQERVAPRSDSAKWIYCAELR